MRKPYRPKARNILIVSDRSNYFSFLGHRLEEDYNVYYLAVRKEDEKILKHRGKKFVSLQRLLEDKERTAPDMILDKENLKKVLGCDLQYDRFYNEGRNYDVIMKRGMKYAVEIARLIKTNRIDLLIVQNDLWDYASVPLAIAWEKGIKILVFEDGFFRPNTIVADRKGVNFNNSCPRDRGFYEGLAIERNRFSNFLNEERARVSGSKIRSPFSIRGILRLAAHPTKIMSADHRLRLYQQDRLFQKEGLERDFILLPLQVHADSQILCHSTIKNMGYLVDICSSALKKYNNRTGRQLALVVKEHPKDKCIVELMRVVKKPGLDIIFLRDADIRKLIGESSLIITINSTVGIEGLLYYKPVITLGKAFYNIDGITYHCCNHEKLDTVIEKALSSEVNRELIDNFLWYLRFCYQVEGDMDHPDEKNILAVISRIKGILES